MKIAFSKVGRTPGRFHHRIDGVEMEGTLLRTGAHELSMKSQIEGEIALICDRCGSEFNEELHLSLDLRLTDREERVSEDLDLVEFLDGTIDLDSLMEGEIASYRSSYHYCPRCQESEQEVDIEY